MIYQTRKVRGHRNLKDEDVFMIVVPHFVFIFDLTAGGTRMH